MAILRVRDKDGNVFQIPAIKGDSGEAGMGVHVGSYVGEAADGMGQSKYIDLGSPNVKAVLLETTSATKPLVIVTEDNVTIDGENAANLISGTVMKQGDNMFLAVHRGNSTNKKDVTYHYIAFVEEGVT